MPCLGDGLGPPTRVFFWDLLIHPVEESQVSVDGPLQGRPLISRAAIEVVSPEYARQMIAGRVVNSSPEFKMLVTIMTASLSGVVKLTSL